VAGTKRRHWIKSFVDFMTMCLPRNLDVSGTPTAMLLHQQNHHLTGVFITEQFKRSSDDLCIDRRVHKSVSNAPNADIGLQ